VIDFGIDKLALIGAVALIVIGPERLPKVARTVGVLLGKAQRYVSQVQAEVNRSIELEELKKMKSGLETAASDVETAVYQNLDEVKQAGDGFHDGDHSLADGSTSSHHTPYTPYGGGYTPPRKNWRLKKATMPMWYKQQNGVRRHVQSGAARVARFRPPGAGPR
jgi:sec-independent protein translocase protein TatB